MHATNRVARPVLAVAAAWLAIAVGAGTAGGVVALIIAAMMAATAISGFCPLYLLFGRLAKRRKLPEPDRHKKHLPAVSITAGLTVGVWRRQL
jgi:hypothetical protein